jgi:transcription antitermination factor NusG
VSENIADPEDKWSINQVIEITGSAFAGFRGTIALIEDKKKTVIVKVNFWGKDIPLELSFFQIRPLDKEQ